MAAKRRKEVIDPNNGVPITVHDIKGYTVDSELRAYRMISIGMIVLTFVFVVFALIPDFTYFTGIYWAAALLTTSIFFAFFPFTWGWSNERILPEQDAVAVLNQRRAASFWYERGSSDETPEEILDRNANVIRHAFPEDRPSP